jgi:hypothetical protein
VKKIFLYFFLICIIAIIAIIVIYILIELKYIDLNIIDVDLMRKFIAECEGPKSKP